VAWQRPFRQPHRSWVAAKDGELAGRRGFRNPSHMHLGLQAYLRWLKRDDYRGRRLCEAGVPAWVVHAEKGDGGLTQHERQVLDACPHVRVVTLPGSVFFLPNEAPKTVADIIAEPIAAI
jgi:pimeloyl-ACP methyl ester carboxylesterase